MNGGINEFMRVVVIDQDEKLSLEKIKRHEVERHQVGYVSYSVVKIMREIQS